MNVFVLSHLFCEDNTIGLNIIFPKAFTYELFFVNLVNGKINCMFVEYNGVSLIGRNCENFPMNIMFIPPSKMLDFNFCSFKCIVASNVQPTMDILSIMMNWIFGHMFIIDLLIIVCLSIDNPNKECIVVQFINEVAFVVYATTLNLFIYSHFQKIILDNFNYMCFTSTCNSSCIL